MASTGSIFTELAYLVNGIMWRYHTPSCTHSGYYMWEVRV